ncbi:MAG: response regulator, partial [Planctomycetota bacterium]
MKQKILVVEDEPEIAELIRMHMDRNGFQTTVVHSGKAGIDEIARSMPDCVLLDLMLPDLDGLEVCRRLRRHEETEKLPVIMVTAKGEESDVVTGIELGADDYITKPFSPRVLVARVKSVLRRTGSGESEPKPGGLITLADELVIDTERHRVSVRG